MWFPFSYVCFITNYKNVFRLFVNKPKHRSFFHPLRHHSLSYFSNKSLWYSFLYLFKLFLKRKYDHRFFVTFNLNLKNFKLLYLFLYEIPDFFLLFLKLFLLFLYGFLLIYIFFPNIYNRLNESYMVCSWSFYTILISIR